MYIRIVVAGVPDFSASKSLCKASCIGASALRVHANQRKKIACSIDGATPREVSGKSCVFRTIQHNTFTREGIAPLKKPGVLFLGWDLSKAQFNPKFRGALPSIEGGVRDPAKMVQIHSDREKTPRN